jgi:colanic acid/amylovoran biosynthesis glycosyltransferase
VKFVGFLSQDDLQELLSMAHIFLHPSETVSGDVEGVPNAMLEAMAAGVPVVATRHGGIPEVVMDGENGLLAEEKDVEQLTEALSRLAEDSNQYQRFSKNAAASVREQFSAPRQIAAVEEIYRKAILAHAGGNPAR